MKGKVKKGISGITAAVMALAALPVLSAGAESAYALGDVDMDGFITGHDSAMVSRALFDDTYTLTDEQLAQADVNEDGKVDQTDADWIHENETICIGNVTQTHEETGVVDAFTVLLYCSQLSAGNTVEVVSGGTLKELPSTFAEYTAAEKEIRNSIYQGQISQLEYNIMDTNADGEVTEQDACNALMYSSRCGVGANPYRNSRYDLFSGYATSEKNYDEDGSLNWIIRG